MQNKHELFNFEGNYKRILEDYTEALEGSAGSNPREVRMFLIDKMIDAYVEQTGDRPDGKVLEKLTNVILHEELTDPRPDKMTLEEYPIMSDRQYEKRTTGKTRQKNKAGVTLTEVPLKQATYVATDGRDYYSTKRTYGNGGA
jgi:hypothetical protein